MNIQKFIQFFIVIFTFIYFITDLSRLFLDYKWGFQWPDSIGILSFLKWLFYIFFDVTFSLRGNQIALLMGVMIGKLVYLDTILTLYPFLGFLYDLSYYFSII